MANWKPAPKLDGNRDRGDASLGNIKVLKPIKVDMSVQKLSPSTPKGATNGVPCDNGSSEKKK